MSPQLDLDGANSKISADKIEGQSGTTVTVTAGHNLAGSGSGLTALNASNLASGTVADARFPATLPASSGVNLTALNASNLGSGTVPTARLGSGTASSSNFLRGDGSWQTAGTTNSKFLAYPTAAANNNVTGTGTYFSWSSDAHTLVANEGSAMGTSAGTAYYTAPETGWYIFTGQVFWYGHSTSTTTQWIFYLITTPRNFQLERIGGASDIPSGFIGESWAVVCKLSSGDTALPRITGYGTGSPIMDFWGGGTSYNWWSGALLA